MCQQTRDVEPLAQLLISDDAKTSLAELWRGEGLVPHKVVILTWVICLLCAHLLHEGCVSVWLQLCLVALWLGQQGSKALVPFGSASNN